MGLVGGSAALWDEFEPEVFARMPCQVVCAAGVLLAFSPADVAVVRCAPRPCRFLWVVLPSCRSAKADNPECRSRTFMIGRP